MAKWFDLKDASGARLKVGNIDGVSHLFIFGLPVIHPLSFGCVQTLGFHRVPGKGYLVRQAQQGERLTEASLRRVFRNVQLVDMAPEEFVLSHSAASKSNQVSQISLDLRGLTRLGRNADGEVVYDSAAGRVIVQPDGSRLHESGQGEGACARFLRVAPIGRQMPSGDALTRAVVQLARGFVRAMDAGEVQHSEDFLVFRQALFGDEWTRVQAQCADEGVSGDEIARRKDEFIMQANETLSACIDAAMLVHVRSLHDVAVDAYGPIARLYDYLPAYQGKARGLASIPQPLAVAAQRLLGETTGKTVLVPNAYDGATFAFLPEGTRIRACESGNGYGAIRLARDDVEWLGGYSPISESGADALFFNMDPKTGRDEYRQALQALRSMSAGGRAVLVFAADDPSRPGRLSSESARFLQTLARSYSVDGVFETAPILSRKAGSTSGLRVFAVRNVAADGPTAAEQERAVTAMIERSVPVLSSWDAVKSHVTELMAGMSRGEAQSRAQLAERAAANETYQRPYIAFSKIGEARTMSPANLQAAAQTYLTNLERSFGAVDDFVSRELAMGLQTLERSFSPEQIDAIAVMLSRYTVGRSSILADDTGIGKGRALAAVATWANKHGHDVFFVTDRANLFSDLARDLNDIGEWDRFRPFILNADGEITVDDGPDGAPRVLASGVKAPEMAAVIAAGRSLADLQCNIGFLTYSQIAGKDSEKALWVKNQLANALVIFDEAHIAAGSDSNVARQVSEMAALAKHVQFASATWAKSHDNLHIYQRALPASITIGTLTETMRKGGDSFSEIFSSMLCAEGALIRREHDLSKLDVEMVIDDQNKERNERISDLVADVLGAATYVSGEMQQVFIRSNADSVRKLREARDARASSLRAKLFSASFGGGSVIYQVMKGVQGALNAEHVAKLAVQSRSKGMKPVIVTDATGEALVNSLVEAMRERAINDGGAAPDGEVEIATPTLRDLLRHVVLRRLSMVKVEEVTAEDVALSTDLAEEGELAGDDGAVADGHGAAEDVPAQQVEVGVDIAATLNEALRGDDDQEDSAEQQLAGVKRKKRVYREVHVMDLADMPQEAKERYSHGLEELQRKIEAVPDIALLGFDVMADALRREGISVGEISGRKHQLRPVEGRPGVVRLVPRLTSKRAVKATIRAFNSGAIDVAIINRSVAAGVSMHASPRFRDQSRRHLIEHQIPENPVDRVQLLGRVNRFDQLTSPLVTSASTGIYGEVRYLMMQNRKLARMSANVRSSRDNAMSLKGVTDLFNAVGRSAIKGFLLDNPLIARRLGITSIEIEKHPDLVNRMTMRIPLLTVAQQKVVYTDVYARFDEIIARAELEGLNPLRPHELNVRAQTVSELMFFGDDSVGEGAGLVSAFDQPVIARRVKWVEVLNPLRYDNVVEAVKVACERLVLKEYLCSHMERNEVTGVDEQVLSVNPDLISRLTQAYEGMVNLAHLTTGRESVADSVLNDAVVRRAWVKARWMKENLPKLMPGARMGNSWRDDRALDGVFSSIVVTDVKPPESSDDYLDLGKWRVTMVTSGDERARTYTLRSLLTAVEADVNLGEITGDLSATVYGPYFAPGVFGKESTQMTLRTMFEFAPQGKRTRFANMLTGNMYLAAEWAAAVGKGTSVNYVDSGGQRHRVIQLPAEMEAVDPEHLPVRIADPVMLDRFIAQLLIPTDAENLNAHVLDTSFRSAMAYASGGAGSVAKRDAIAVVVPRQMIALSCSPKDARRIMAALSAGQRTMRTAQLGPGVKAADDPSNVAIRVVRKAKEIAALPDGVGRAMAGVSVGGSGDGLGLEGAASGGKEGKAAVLTLRVSNQQQAERAVELVRLYSGLEIYATSHEHKQLARQVIRETMSARREEMQRLRDHTRQQIEEAGQLHAVVDDDEPSEALAAPIA